MPTVVVDVPVTVRVQEHEIREGLSAAVCAPPEMMDVPATRLGECLAAAETLALLGYPTSQPPLMSVSVGSHLAPRARSEVAFPRRVMRIRRPCDLDVLCHLGLLCPVQADGLDFPSTGSSLAGEPPWWSAGGWEISLPDPPHTLLGVSASRPTPQHLRDVPVHVRTGVCTGSMPVIVRPSPDQRVESQDDIPGPGLWLGCDRGSHLAQERFDTLGGRTGEKRPAVLPDGLAETVKALAALRDGGLSR